MEEAFLAALSEDEIPAPEHHVFIDQLEQRRAAKVRDTIATQEEDHDDANEPNRTGRVSR
jgi:hypothetical protein